MIKKADTYPPSCVIKVAFYVFFIVLFHKNVNAQLTTNSVLNSGQWWQFSVPEKGIYKLSGEDITTLTGLSLSNIDTNNILVYKNDEGVRPQSNSANRVDDLKEVAVHISTSSSQFTTSDYILVYVRGTEKVIYDSVNKVYTEHKNVYATKSYIYINFNGSRKGKRVLTVASNNSFITEYTAFDTYSVIENDEYKILNSGRKWYDNPIKSTQTYSFKLGNTMKRGKVTVIVDAMCGQNFNSGSQLAFLYQGNSIGQLDFPKLPRNYATYSKVGNEKSGLWKIDTAADIEDSFDIAVRFSSVKIEGERGYIDRIAINYKSDFMFTDAPYTFCRVLDSSDVASARVAFQNNKQESHRIWDITDAYNPIERVLVEETGKNPYFNFETNGNVRDFVIIKEDMLPVPTFVQRVENQNLHGLVVTDMLIICPAEFVILGEQWKAWRQSQSGITTTVVSTQSIYHEFSGGQQDVSAIRDFIRMIYLKGTAGSGRLKYVLFLGDGSYDYLDRIEGNTNKVPIYESRDSLDPINSYGSDDFYGLMDVSEGEWEESNANTATLEIGIGRIPINTLEEGQMVLAKMKHYESSPKVLGDWRNKIILTADDEDNGIHALDALLMDEVINDSGGGDFEVIKMLLDDYPQQNTGGKETSNAFQAAVHKALSDGGLIFNYTGHGREDLLAEENMLDLNFVNKMTNMDRLSFFLTATCQFGRIDDPKYFYKKTGGESALLNPNGGAIALFSTGRPVFSFSNRRLNKSFYENLFKKSNGKYRTIGEIFRDTKNSSISGVRNRNFILLGDPSLTLNFPKNRVSIAIKDNETRTKKGVLMPSHKTTIDGEITDVNNGIIATFNGIVEVTIFDLPQQQQTIGFQQEPVKFTDYSSLLYKGKISVSNGTFTFSFITPKSVNINHKNSFKIITYAYDETTNSDANGSGLELSITAPKETAITDSIPPQVIVYKQVTIGQYYLDIQISDDSGIDLTNNINGSGVTITDRNDKIYSVSQYFKPLDSSGLSGSVSYNVGMLEVGTYVYKITVKDVYGNKKETFAKIINGDSNTGLIASATVYPTVLDSNSNDRISFNIQHRGFSHDIKVILQIFNTFGDLLHLSEMRANQSGGFIEDLKWQPTGGYQSGQFLYILVLKDLNTNEIDTERGRFIVK